MQQALLSAQIVTVLEHEVVVHRSFYYVGHILSREIELLATFISAHSGGDPTTL